jgi:uncharacterized protein YwqG
VPKKLTKKQLAMIQQRLAKEASIATLHPGTPSDALGSMFGAVSTFKGDEPWPEYGGTPMIGLLQIRTSELPNVPHSLRGVALLRVWVSDVEDALCDTLESVVIRASPTLPSGPSDMRQTTTGHPKACRMTWASQADGPGYYDLPRTVPDEIAELYSALDTPSHNGTKIGGYQHRVQFQTAFDVTGLTQTSPDDEYEYVLQIGSEPAAGWMWGDGGIAYVGRGVTDLSRWKLDWQAS